MTAVQRATELTSVQPTEWPPLLRRRLDEMGRKHQPVMGEMLFRELMVYAQCVDHLFCAPGRYRATAEDYNWYDAHKRNRR